MKLRGSTEKKVTKDKSGETLSRRSSTDALLVYWNLDNKINKQDSRVLYIFILNKKNWTFAYKFTIKTYVFEQISFKVFTH